MSTPKRTRRDGSPRTIRRDAKLLHLPEAERKLISGWLRSDGPRCCLQRMATQLQITAGQSALYEALAFWESEERRDRTRALALAQIDQEAEERAMSPAEKLSALDRRMAEIFAAGDQHGDYQDARYLIIADEAARTKAELDAAKLALKKLQVNQGREQLELDREKFKAAIRTKVEAGLAEIAEQVKGNTAAEAALAKLQVAISA
jgi:hypothetical protein